MKRITVIIAAVLCASTWVFAQVDSKSKPIPTDKPLEPTVIEAERSRSETNDGESYLIFSGSVKLSATNLVITCNQLEVFAKTKKDEEETVIGEISSIQKIIATGNVRIVQEERTATAGRMEVLPNEDVIILEEDPILFQGSYTMGGPGTQLKFERGKSRVEMIGGTENMVTFSGPPIQDLGFEDDDETIIPEEEEDKPVDKAPEAEPKTNDDSLKESPMKDAK